ncbi:hypothetical protein NKG05_20785 [Oerskovia sp. M15]
MNETAGADLLLKSSQGISLATAGSPGFGATRVVSSGWTGPRTIAPGTGTVMVDRTSWSRTPLVSSG